MGWADVARTQAEEARAIRGDAPPSPPAPAASSPVQEPEVPDPADYTVKRARDWIADHPEQAAAFVAREAEGQQRAGILTALD